jgi:hypothetical protein
MSNDSARCTIESIFISFAPLSERGTAASRMTAKSLDAAVDYANVGQKQIITLVDADSFWVDAYFTETALGSIHQGDPVNFKLIG